jgi:hypothetical protein
MMPPSRIYHYKIAAKLGEGGMGAVYRTADTKLNGQTPTEILIALWLDHRYPEVGPNGARGSTAETNVNSLGLGAPAHASSPSENPAILSAGNQGASCR